jgi:LPXTG-motif cell wall-anchored protein
MKKSRNLIRILLFICLFFPFNEWQSLNTKAASLEINGRIGGRVEGTETGKIEESSSTHSSDKLASPNEKIIILDRLPKAGEHSTKRLRTVGFGFILAVFLINKRKKRKLSQEAG